MAAPEITAHGGNRERCGCRQKVKERFLLNGVYGLRDQFAVDQRIEYSLPVLPYPADPLFGVLDLAAVMTEVANDLTVFTLLIKHGFFQGEPFP
jgi:hypothetical protein